MDCQGGRVASKDPLSWSNQLGRKELVNLYKEWSPGLSSLNYSPKLSLTKRKANVWYWLTKVLQYPDHVAMGGALFSYK